ncbi:unnamed protein product (macronuclear) [Paramecium tetraurelia]|uniref:RRM domain-containing protein n=1 Tax=Paramecium tetraurelia TaxID=5888 RepID=A0CD58_PARTE|nr:uncharacterized protein GSPATT00006936001 [Paramecium tetraurelia]CAK68725.1 unnamed protein product [Paramecium tetraurelia]|eukprot:XP_001436122.1 hypothetical protein (macronuclear) [Paramecium tetraurelia strain d4-2]
MFSYSLPNLPDSLHFSHLLLLTLTAPPANLNPEYFSSLMSQYGPVANVKILHRSLMECRVLVEMANIEAAKNAKKALDQLSSNFIKCSYYQDDKLIPHGSFTIGSYETIEDTTSSTFKNRHSTSINDIIQDGDSKPHSSTVLPISQKLIPSQKNIQSTKTVCLNGISGKELDAHKLYNIFSNFGNVDKIILINLKNFALVKYLKEDQAYFVYQNCQNLSFFESSLTITFAADDSIEKLVGLDTLYRDQDYYVGSQDTDRFNPNNKMILLPPSQVLHISNLKKVSSNAETMWDIFSEFGVVEAVKVLNSQFKFMCLIKMETLKQALEVMALMHNEEVDGRNIQISFTKAKI